jgi:hypothetical protein
MGNSILRFDSPAVAEERADLQSLPMPEVLLWLHAQHSAAFWPVLPIYDDYAVAFKALNPPTKSIFVDRQVDFVLWVAEVDVFDFTQKCVVLLIIGV